MDIVIIDNFPHSYLGGGEAYLLQLTEEYESLGARVSFASVSGSAFEAAVKKTGFPVLSRAFTPLSARPDAKAIRHFVKSFNGEKPVVLQGSGFYASWLATRAARKQDIVVASVQSESFFADELPRNRMRRALGKRVDRFVTVSNALTDQLAQSGVDRSCIVQLSPFIDVDEMNQKVESLRAPAQDTEQDDQILNLGFLGRLEEVKGVDILVDSLAHLDEFISETTSLDSWKLFVAGEGSLEQQLKNQVSEQGLADKVSFLGHIAPEELFSRIDLLVAPSRSEGLNLAVLEAQSVGIPVLATAVGGLKDIVVDGETGFVIEPPSGTLTPKDVAHAIVTAWQSPQKDVVSAQAQEIVARKFSREAFSKNVSEFYKQLEELTR